MLSFIKLNAEISS